MREFLMLIMVPLFVGVVANIISEWLIRKYLDKGDK